jgi:hypothetical protein
MEWSTDLYLVSLLQEYVTPEPFIADFVRDQLITDEQKDALTVSIRQVTKIWRTISTPYDAFVNYTGLNWRKEEEVDELMPLIRGGMFDLMLGDRLRRMLINGYEEVDAVRRRFEYLISVHKAFVESRCEDMSIWWDRADVDAVPMKQWVSTSLAEDGDFAKVVLSWLEDGRKLQNWLREYEERGVLANNPAQENKRVVSEEAAVEIIGFAKVETWLCGLKLILKKVLGTGKAA